LKRQQFCELSVLEHPLAGPAKGDGSRFPNVGLQKLFNLTECIVVFALRVGAHAIAWNFYFEVPHVSVIRGEKNTDVGGDPRDDESAGVKTFEKHTQGCRIK